MLKSDTKMNNILHKTNPVIKIWSPDDLLRILDIDAYKTKVENDCQQLIFDTESQVAQITQQAHDVGISDAQIEIDELVKRIDKQIDKFYTELDSGLAKIIYRTLDKFGFDNINTQNLAQIIQSELHGLAKQHIEIDANKYTIELFSASFISDSDKIRFNIDNRIPKNKVYLRSQFYEQILDLDDAKHKIQNCLLNGSI